MIEGSVVGGGMVRFGIKPRRLLRPLISVVVAYAVATQTLLIALGALTIAAQANEGLPAFELCHHDQGTPNVPGGGPVHSGCNHCIFCFAASHHAVVAPAPVLFARVNVEIIDIPWTADNRFFPVLSDYSIASPRGPPIRA